MSDTPKGESEEHQEQGTVELTQAEHNALQARLRKYEKAERERQEQERKQQEEALKAAGRWDEMVGKERAERERLEQELRRRDATDAVAAAATAAGYNPEQVNAIRRMVSADSIEVDAAGKPNQVQVERAVEGVTKQFPNLFRAQSQSAESVEQSQAVPAQQPQAPAQPQQPEPQKRPAGPPASPPAPSNLPAGYISPEEYSNTPANIRLSKEFQARVAASEPYWKEQGVFGNIPASTFAVGQGS